MRLRQCSSVTLVVNHASGMPVVRKNLVSCQRRAASQARCSPMACSDRRLADCQLRAGESPWFACHQLEQHAVDTGLNESIFSLPACHHTSINKQTIRPDVWLWGKTVQQHQVVSSCETRRQPVPERVTAFSLLRLPSRSGHAPQPYDGLANSTVRPT